MQKATTRLEQLSQQTTQQQQQQSRKIITTMKLLYPQYPGFTLDPSLLAGHPVTLHPYNPRDSTIPDAHTDADVLVTWTNSPANLKDAAARMKNLKWIQSLAAGPNDVLNAGFDADKILISTGSGLHDHTVAEHTLALLLAAARRLDEMKAFQLRGQWPGHLGGPQPDRPEGKFTSLRGAHVGVWGFGNIAKALAPSLTTLGAQVTGIARSHGVRDGIEVFAEDSLPSLLPKLDALVMILPGSAATQNALGPQRLKLLPSHAWVVNVGRGTTIDEEALADALEKGEIGGAALDVFATEPLPEGSRLWKTPNTIVSPHAAGGRPQGAEDLVGRNLRRFLGGQEVENRI